MCEHRLAEKGQMCILINWHLLWILFSLVMFMHWGVRAALCLNGGVLAYRISQKLFVPVSCYWIWSFSFTFWSVCRGGLVESYRFDWNVCVFEVCILWDHVMTLKYCVPALKKSEIYVGWATFSLLKFGGWRKQVSSLMFLFQFRWWQ